MILKRPCSETYKKNNIFSGFSGRYFSETLKKQWLFLFCWETLWKQAGRTRVSQKQENIVFKVFLKSSDQKKQKQYCFLCDSIDAMLRNIQNTMVVLVFLVATFQKHLKKQ